MPPLIKPKTADADTAEKQVAKALWEKCVANPRGIVHKCVACGDTGKDSRGEPCLPCVRNGRIKP